MSEPLHYAEIKRDRNVKIEDISKTPDESDIGFFVEVVLSNPIELKEKSKRFPFCHENRISPQDKFCILMNVKKPKNYPQKKKLICDWTDKQNYLIHYGMLRVYMNHGKVVHKVLETISFRQWVVGTKHKIWYSKTKSTCIWFWKGFL